MSKLKAIWYIICAETWILFAENNKDEMIIIDMPDDRIINACEHLKGVAQRELNKL